MHFPHPGSSGTCSGNLGWERANTYINSAFFLTGVNHAIIEWFWLEGTLPII